ncbi:hypothetical protein PIN31115_04451 [Pandoraea iniqua]|uniref:Transcriptional regulator, AbiEi antitoxin, Type IV TA system n=1 Tax=Pandoraea iniqua TaxID=2508288 RepID=A0A5E4YFM3_9BURK|nr:DUF6088 family protein [Pandoraea iniqua]VVE47155.1 hypothetical protein PIN31115_04451 [Pandoraea iniqua]
MSTVVDKVFDATSGVSGAYVWVPADFLHIADRVAINRALQRLCDSRKLRRVGRGLYDKPRLNSLTGKLSVPDYQAVISAIARRDDLKLLIDGMTAANNLGMTNCVPARVIVHCNSRRQPLTLGNLVIEFRRAAPSRLLWSGRPAMSVVQALHWLHDALPTDGALVSDQIARILQDPSRGELIRQDLISGYDTLPSWMQSFLQSMLAGDKA